MAKSNKQVIIDFIVTQLKLGKQRADILGKVGKKWGTSRTSFDRLLKIGKEQHTIEQGLIKIELAALDRQNAIEERKSQIADALERKEILTKIARGQIPLSKPIIVDGELRSVQIVPDWQDRKNAIAELNKMDGDYAPQKTDITSNGDTILQPLPLNIYNTAPPLAQSESDVKD